MVAGLWVMVEGYAERAALHFFGANQADVEDLVSDAFLICMDVRDKHGDKGLEEQALIARRAVWNKCLDILRHRQVCTKALEDPALLRRARGHSIDDPARRVAAAECFELVRAAIPAADLPVFELHATGHTWAEMAAKTGKSITSLHHSLGRIHTAARRHKDGV